MSIPLYQSSSGGSGSSAWSALTSATGALTLANAGNATTFNQTSAVTWSWANTTVATVSTTNASPILQLSANYWTGAASAPDSWTISSSLVAGTNGTSTLSIGRTGSSGTSQIQLSSTGGSLTKPQIYSTLSTCGIIVGLGAGTPLFVCDPGGGAVDYLRAASGSTYQGSITTDTPNLVWSFVGMQDTSTVGIGITQTPSPTRTTPLVVVGAMSIPWATTGAGPYIGLSIGARYAVSAPQLSWAPTAGAGNLYTVQINPTINMTGSASGLYTGLRIAPVETALIGTGHKLIDCYSGAAGTTQVFSLDNTGKQQSYTPNGAQWVFGSNSELLTLSTVGLTTDTVGNLLPANAIIESVVARITTAITTTTNWAIGDATISNRFAPALATLTLGTTVIGLTHVDLTGTSGPRQTAAAKVRITCTGANPGAGVVRLTVFYRQFVAPTS